MTPKSLFNLLARTPDGLIITSGVLAFFVVLLAETYSGWRTPTAPPKPPPSRANVPAAAAPTSGSVVVTNYTRAILTVNGRRLMPKESMQANPTKLSLTNPPCQVASYAQSAGTLWLVCKDAPAAEPGAASAPAAPTSGPAPTARTPPRYGETQRFVMTALGNAAAAQERWKASIGQYACTLEHLESGIRGEVGPDLNVKRVNYKLMLFGSDDVEHCTHYMLLAMALVPGEPHFCVQPGVAVCESEDHPSDDDKCLCR